MKKMTKMRWVAAVLSLLMILGLANHVMSSASGEPEATAEDITNFVDLTVNDFFLEKRINNENKKLYLYKDGQSQTVSGDEYKLEENGLTVITYKWGVSTENIAKVKNGNYFMINLPSQTILLSAVGEYPVLSDGKEIGRLFVNQTPGKAKVVFTGIEEGTSILKNGEIGVYAYVKNIDITELRFEPKSETSTAITFPVTTNKPAVQQVGTTGDNGIFNNPWYAKPLGAVNTFRKEAQQVNGSNKIQFTFRVNYKDIRSIYNERATAGNSLGDEFKFKPKKNIYIIDESMPEDLELDLRDTQLAVYYWAPVLDDAGNVTKQLSDRTITSDTIRIADEKMMYGDKTFFTVIRENGPEDGWNDFKNRIIAMNPTRVIGIYNNKKIVITVGNMPFDDLHYGDFYNGHASLGTEYASGADYLSRNIFTEFGKVKKNHQRLNAAQIESMKEAYSGKPIVDFVLRFYAVPKGITKGSYTNTATMYWDHETPISSTGTAKMAGAFGIVAMEKFQNKYTVTKEWKGAKKDSVKVYLLADGAITKEVILSDANNWTHDFLHLPEKTTSGTKIEYSVKEEEVAGYRSVVEPVSGKYASVIKNFEQRDITLTKKWLDEKGDVLTNPNIDNVTFYLHNENEINPTEKNALRTIVLEKDSWTKTVKVDKTDDLGNEIVYKVSEKVVDGFKQVSVTGDMENGFVITNAKIKPEPESIGGSGSSPSPVPTTTTPPETVVTTPTPVEVAPTTPTPVTSTPEPSPIVITDTTPVAVVEPPVVPSVITYPPVPEVVNIVIPNEIPSTTGPLATTSVVDLPNNTGVEEELDIDGNVVPRGDADLDIDILNDDIPEGDTEIEDEGLDVEKDKTPKGNKKVLALTGGLQTIFLPILSMLAILLIAFLTVQFMIKKGK